jgi:hypothetical protein
MPLINKYGRRPVTITAVWCAVAKEYANFLMAGIVMGIVVMVVFLSPRYVSLLLWSVLSLALLPWLCTGVVLSGRCIGLFPHLVLTE